MNCIAATGFSRGGNRIGVVTKGTFVGMLEHAVSIRSELTSADRNRLDLDLQLRKFMALVSQCNRHAGNSTIGGLIFQDDCTRQCIVGVDYAINLSLDLVDIRASLFKLIGVVMPTS